MRKISLLLFSISYFLLAITASAQTPTPSDNESEQNPIDQQITDLKTRIASRVAELNLVEKRGIVGTATDVSDTQITLSDLKGNTRFVDVDELTTFPDSSNNDSFGISDIAVGDTIGVLGLYNKESRRILARFVNTVTIPTTIYGVIDSVDEELFRVKVLTEDKKEVYLDVEVTTITSSFSKEDGLTRSGFSKIEGNERVIAVGNPNEDDENIITATRIILLPEIPKNPKIN